MAYKIAIIRNNMAHKIVIVENNMAHENDEFE